MTINDLLHTAAVGALSCRKTIPYREQKYAERLTVPFFSKNLRNPIGLAAGFDKNCQCTPGCFGLGFASVEVGSCTPAKQESLFFNRIRTCYRSKSVLNRVGIQNEGFAYVKNNMQVLYKKISQRKDICVGISISCNRLQSHDKRYLDFFHGVKEFSNICDYIALNISSPNTPKLRDLESKSQFTTFLKNLTEEIDKTTLQNIKPIFVKISPDIDDSSVEYIVHSCINNQYIRGIIIGNTTNNKQYKNTINKFCSWEEGGVSGQILNELSYKKLQTVYKASRGRLYIVACGGVFTGKDVLQRLLAGASYIQIYSSLIFRGPQIVDKITQELIDIMDKKGIYSIQDITSNQV